MKLINDYWVDKNGNKWSRYNGTYGYTKQEAINYSKTLINCSGCTDCENCIDCVICVRCVGCINCKKCILSSSCIECEDCDYCTFLIKSTSCVSACEAIDYFQNVDKEEYMKCSI